MKTSERVATLENDIKATAEEIKIILLEIRSFISENRSPLRSQSQKEKPV